MNQPETPRSFSSVKIPISDSDDREKVDYSIFKFDNGAVYMADCFSVRLAEMDAFKKDSQGAAHKTGEKVPCVKFSVSVIDKEGQECPLSKDCDIKVSYGSMRSNLYKCAKALAPNEPEEHFQDEALFQALLDDLAAKAKASKIPCMVEIKLKPYKVQDQNTGAMIERVRISIANLLPELQRPAKKAEAVAGQPAVVGAGVSSGNVSFDDDDIPF